MSHHSGLQGCDAFYERAQALHEVSIDICEGEIVSLVGRNGAGKSTVLKSIAGLVRVERGTRHLGGEDCTALNPHELSRAGVGYVPEDRRIFKNLTVRENLQLAFAAGRTGVWDFARVIKLFPQLEQRLEASGDTLSGGEQQMLAIGRSLLTNPVLLLLDEPTEGLAPLVVKDLVKAIRIINSEGMSILLVEQNFKIPLKLAKRQYVLDGGRVVWSGSIEDFLARRDEIEHLISV